MCDWNAASVLYKIFQTLKKLARPKRFELLTPRFVVWCSIQLSYGRTSHVHNRGQPNGQTGRVRAPFLIGRGSERKALPGREQRAA